MVIFNNSSDSDNQNEKSTPPRNLLLLERLKQARMQRTLLQNGETKEKVDQPVEQKSNKKFYCVPDVTSSSNSSLVNREELIKRTTLQEKIFSMHCKNFNENKHGKQASKSKLKSLDSLSKIRKSRKLTLEEDDEPEYATTAGGVLHFKQPIINQHNESIYYGNRGRMEPMDWSVVHNVKSNSYDKTDNTNELNENIEFFDKIQKLQENKPEPLPEFINFVSNSCNSEAVYEGRNNFDQIRNTIDSPLLKVQRILNNNPKENLLIDQEIKQVFEPSQLQNNIMNTIDSPSNNLITICNGNAKSDGTADKDVQMQSKNLTQKQPLNSIMKLIPNICEFDSKDSSLALLNKKVSDSNNLKKKSTDNYSDDMFNFTNVRSKPKSNLSITSKNGSISNNESTTFSNVISKSIDCKSNSHHDKLKKFLLDDRFSSSLDSHDASSSKFTKKITSVQEPIALKDEMPKKESKTVSTQYFRQLNENINANASFDTSDDLEEGTSEQIDILMEKCSIEHLKKFNHNRLLDENNTVKEKETKIVAEQEPLLREVSTRYFTKSSNVQNDKMMSISDESNKLFNLQELIPKTRTNNIEEIDNNQNSNSSFQSNESLKQTSKNIFAEECISDLNQEILSFQRVEEIINTDTDDSTIITHEDKSTEKNSVHIQEIDINAENNENNTSLVEASLNEELTSDAIKHNNIDLYEEIDSDEEFDIVNIEELSPFSMIVNKLQQMKEYQKSLATEMDLKDSKLFSDKENTKHNSSSSSISKSTEHSLASENNYSGASASVSSNIDTDNDMLNSSDSSNIFSAKKNLKNTKTNEIESNNDILVNYNESESKTIIEQDTKPTISNRRKKMKNALTSLQKRDISEDIKEACNQVKQLDDLNHTETSTETVTKRQLILQKLKQRSNR